MAEPKNHDPLLEPVSTIARRDVAIIPEDSTVQQALDGIRSRGVGERIVYFYVADGEGRLVGVIPTRRLLMALLGEHDFRDHDPADRDPSPERDDSGCA